MSEKHKTKGLTHPTPTLARNLFCGLPQLYTPSVPPKNSKISSPVKNGRPSIVQTSTPRQNKTMSMVKLLIAGVAFLIGSWLAYDGTRALVMGDYTTAKSGPHAGQLGPWSHVAAALGLDPRGGLMKSIHVGLGAAWLIAMIVFFINPTPGWWALLICAIGSLWYLPVGTFLGIVEICLLLLPQIRNLR